MSEDYIEISKSRLQALESVNSLKEALWNDPNTGPRVKELVKEKFPNANIPEVDMARNSRKVETELLAKVSEKEKAVDAKIASFEAKWVERDESVAREKEERVFESEVERTRKKYNLTQEGMEKVFSRMKEKNNPDVEAAAAWVTDHEVKAPVESSNYAPQTMDMYGANSGAKEWEDLNRDPIKYGDREIARMANDFANGNFGKYKEFGGDL
jgi:hypothetical protein